MGCLSTDFSPDHHSRPPGAGQPDCLDCTVLRLKLPDCNSRVQISDAESACLSFSLPPVGLQARHDGVPAGEPVPALHLHTRRLQVPRWG